MLELPEIKSSDFESTLEGLTRQIPALTEKWTNFSEGGVGITILELLTYISLKQRENMNKISGGALYNLGRLFGCEPRHAVPARGMAQIGGAELTRRLTKLYSEDAVFETLADCEPQYNKAALYGRSVGTKILPYGLGNKGAGIKLFSDSDTFIIAFSAPFPSKKECSVYFRFDEAGRVYPENMDLFFRNFEVVWQYYGFEAGFDGWHNAEIIRDDTYSCFKSGFLKFVINGKHNALGNFYLFRGTAKKRGFDIFPMLTGVFTGVCEIARQDTKCLNIRFNLDKFNKNAMNFSCALAKDGALMLMINTKNGYAEAGTLDVEFDIDYSNGGCRLVTSSRAELSKLFAELKDEEKNGVLMLIIYEKPYVKEFCSLRANGSAGQRIYLNFSGIVSDKTELLVSEVKNGKIFYRPWKYAEKLYPYGPSDKVFNCTDTYIAFGDGEHGAVPCTRCAEILITSLVLSDGADYPAGTLHGEDNTKTALRITPVTGGSVFESPDKFFARAISEDKPETLVTIEDFKRRTIKTKGLFIKRVEVFPTPEGEGTKPNSVTVAIEPDAENAVERLSELKWYIDNVYAELKDLCPITMELIVKFPEYVKIDVELSICGTDIFGDIEGLVRASVESLFSGISEPRVDYAEIFGRLNRLIGSGRITELTLLCESSGTYIGGDGSVIFKAHGRPILNKLTINSEA